MNETGINQMQMIKKIFVLLIIVTLPALAGVTGKLSGKITDRQTGEPLPGANVLIEKHSLGAAADFKGEYTLLNIPPGIYTVRVSFLGYKTITVENVKIQVDQTTTLNVELSTESITVDEVVVTAKAPLIQKDLTSTISTITREKIENLPVASFTELLSLQAGVVGDGSNLHIRGGRSNEVAYLIDGMYVKDPLLGGLAASINNDAIQEMSLLSGTFNAEYGNALSGVVNIVTRDGSEKYQGKIELRSSEFGVERYSRLRELRFNGSFEGPLWSSRSRFFLSAEQDKRGSYLPFGYNRAHTGFLKISSSELPNMKLSLSARGNQGERQSYSHSYKYIPDQYLRRKTDSWQNTFTLTHTVATNFFYDLRVSYFNQGYYSGINKDTADYLSINQRVYFEDIGNGFEFYAISDPEEVTDSRTATVDIKADALWQIGQNNEMKAGIQFQQHKLRLFYVYDPKRNYPYKNDYNTSPFEAAAYIQDKIELPYLIINLGLRFDYVNANVTYRENPLDPLTIITAKPRYQLSPRVGIAHPITDRTKLHFAYGHFFQNPDFQYLFENNQYDMNVREPLLGQANLDAQRTIAYEVGISHQFNEQTALHATAYYKDVTGLIGTRYYFPFVDGRYVGYTLYVNEDYANIKGFEVNLDIRPDKNLSGGLTYTYSVAKGSASSETEQYPGTSESTQLYYLDFDKPHVLNASLAFQLGKDEGPVLFGNKWLEETDYSIIFKASSGYPYTPGGRDIGFVTRNSLRQPATYEMDLMIGKEIKLYDEVRLRIFAEVLNLTDRRNILFVYSDTGEPDFTNEGNASDEYMKNPAYFGPPRSIRLGASVKF